MVNLKRVALCVLVAAAVSGCASLSKPPGGTYMTSTNGQRELVTRGRVDDPRLKHVACLRSDHIPYTEPGPDTIQVGQPGVGPTIDFLATAGAAQNAQITGQAQSAEVIGSALLYPNAAPDSELQPVESCMALGVKG